LRKLVEFGRGDIVYFRECNKYTEPNCGIFLTDFPICHVTYV
jgi:hypothetical protein